MVVFCHSFMHIPTLLFDMGAEEDYEFLLQMAVSHTYCRAIMGNLLDKRNSGIRYLPLCHIGDSILMDNSPAISFSLSSDQKWKKEQTGHNNQMDR